MYAVNEPLDDHVVRPIAQAYVDYVPAARCARACRNFFGNIDDLFSGDQRPAAGQAGQGGQRLRPRDRSTRWRLRRPDRHRLGRRASRRATRTSARRSATGASRRGRTCSFRCGARRRCATAPAARSASGTARSATFPTCRCATSSTASARSTCARRRWTPTSLIDQAALDRYTFVRRAYLQRRAYLVYDGNPPPEKDEE